MGRVDGVVFDVAVFLNLGRDHLDFHADVDDYFAAKASLFTPERARRGLVNVDDELRPPAARRGHASRSAPSPRAARDADWRAVDVELDRRAASTFTVVGPDGSSVAAGVPAARRLQRRQRAGRHRRLRRGRASTPAPVADGHRRAAAAYPAGSSGSTRARTSSWSSTTRTSPTRSRRRSRTLRPLTDGPGDRRARRRRRPRPRQAADHGRDRRPAGRRAGRHRRQPAQRGPGRDPRGACSTAPAAAAPRCVEIGDRRPRSARPSRRPGPGDIVLVAGKGHETGQEVAGVVHPFDDRDVRPRGAGPPDDPDDPRRDRRRRRRRRSTATPDVTVTGAGLRRHPRRRRAGGLFVAVAGEQVDGHDFAAAAVAAGAAAVLGSRATGVPTVVVDDPVAALGRLARHVRRHAARPTVVALTGSQGKTGTKDSSPTCSPAPGRRSPPSATSTTRSASRSPCCGPTADTRYLVVEMGARGDRPHRLPVPRSRRRGRRGAQRRHRPHRRVRLAGGDRAWPRARSSRRCPPTASPCSTPTTTSSPRWPRAPTRRVLDLRRARGDVAWRERRARRPRPPVLRARVRRRLGTPVTARPGRRPPGRATPPPRPRWRSPLGLAARRGRRARCATPTPASPLADGGARARRRAGRRQRRLQRQPRVDARRARGAGRRSGAAAVARTVAVLGEMLELGAERRRRAPRASGALAAEAGRRPAGRRRGPAATASPTGASRRPRAGRGRSSPRRGVTRRSAWLRENVAAARRRPGEGIARGGPGARSPTACSTPDAARRGRRRR